MRKLFKGILIVFGVTGVLVILGAVGSLFLLNEAVEVVDESIQEVEQESKELNVVLDELVQAIEWQVTTDSLGDIIMTGILENTTDQEIEYIEIAYEFKKDGITIEESWTNASEIEPGEKVQIEIITCIQEYDEFNVKGSDGWE